jgi:uncharacterized integral membrane protein
MTSKAVQSARCCVLWRATKAALLLLLLLLLA